MYILFYFSFPLISSIFAISMLILFLYYGKKPRYDYSSSMPVIDLLYSLSNICPLGSANKWKLLPHNFGSVRCWEKSYTIPQANENINLYGSAVIVNSSSATVGSIIADMTKWADWNPCNTSQLIVKSFNDKKLRRDHYMEADQIISIVCKTNAIQSQTVMYRFHVYSDNKAGCILFWNVKLLEFMFFLIQPVKNNHEFSQCVITHLAGSESKSSATYASVISQRLRNIQDFLSHSSLNLVPFLLKPEEIKKSDSSVLNQQGINKPASQESFFSLATARAHKRDVKNTVFILVPFISYTLWLHKHRRDFKLGVKNIDDSDASVKPQSQPISKLSGPKFPMRRAVSDLGAKSPPLALSPTLSKPSSNGMKCEPSGENQIQTGLQNQSVQKSKPESGTTSEDSESKCSGNNKYSLKVQNFHPSVKLKSFSETALSKFEMPQDFEETGQNSENSKRLNDIDEKPEYKLVAMHNPDQKEMFNSSISDYEVVEGHDVVKESNEFTVNRIACLMTQGNYGASELQAEVLLASQFEDCLNVGNFKACGGWMLHSHHKGLTVLGKVTTSQFLQITSFLCQTQLKVCLKDVWKFVKCPQFRFICDETVKTVEVLEKLSSSQKIIHTYHEVGSFLRKELVDFCLLQTERVELNKCYSCFYSIENDKYPFMKSVIRGTLRPSGWIVEEVDNRPNRSKVTYMIQMICNPDSLLLQELSTLVAQAVHNLKHYITAKPV